MTLELVLGWWALPVLATLVSFGWALVASANDRPRGDYDFSGLFNALARLAAALILSLAAWLIWSLLT